MKKTFILIMLLVTTLFVANKAEAKWWIFGQGNDEVNINYLYLNKTSYDESGKNVILYKDSLTNGNINITGKATVKTGKIGAVYVSVDNKETWVKAKLNDNGTFQYNFAPELEKTYELYIKVIDTAGRNNAIDDTYKKVSVIDENISQIIKDTLDKVIKSYENEEENLFMTYVSPNFAGDEAILDTAIRNDFHAFDYIKLNYFINNISKAPDGKVYVSIQYNRTVVSTKSGETFADYGNTELVFSNEEGKFKIFSMKNPLMFGLSDAGNVATGTIQSTNNDPVLLVDEAGNVQEKPFREAIDIIENGSDGTSDDSSSTESGTATLNNTNIGFIFSSGSTTTGSGDISLEYNILITVDTGGKALKLDGVTSLASVTEVPATGYDWNISDLNINVGSVYALQLSNGKYGIMKITGYTDGGYPVSTLNIEWEYQPDGSRNF